MNSNRNQYIKEKNDIVCDRGTNVKWNTGNWKATGEFNQILKCAVKDACPS